MILAAVSLLAGFCLPTPSRADSGTVLPGWDLFQTVPSMTYDNNPMLNLGNLQGVPLNTYNFGGSIGTQNVGLTDTIVQRMQTVTTTGTTTLQVDALQLQSVNTIPALGNQYAFVVLDPNIAFPSTGSMTISNNDTWTSTLNIYFDIYAGSSLAQALTTTPVATDQEITFTSQEPVYYWSHTAQTGASPALLISGVNYFLNGTDDSEDFWPNGSPDPTSCVPFGEAALLAAHGIDVTQTPEPSGLALLGLGMLCLAIKTRRGRK
jgi:hypothetical protein